MNAWDHGVAQKRERVFIIGIREDLDFEFVFPTPLPEDQRTQLLRDVIGDLPEPAANHNPEEQLPKGYQNVIDGKTKSNYGNGIRINDGSEPANTLLARYWEKGPPSEVFQPENHDPKPLSESALAYMENNHEHRGSRIKSMDEPSATLPAVLHKGVPYGVFYPDEVAPTSEPENHERKDISEKAIEGYARRDGDGGFGVRINEWDKPSPTIFGRIANEGKAFIHPSANDTPENHEGALFDNVNLNWNYDKSNREYSWENPSATIGTKHRCEGIHPEQKPKPRRFTVRECLRIQSVPDWYVLPESISLSAQYRIVGNGVASRVAYLLGISLAQQIREAEQGNRRSLPRLRQITLEEAADA